MENNPKSKDSGRSGLLHKNKFAGKKVSKRKLKVSRFEMSNHNKKYQEYIQQKQNIEKEMDKIRFKIGDKSFQFQGDGTWKSRASDEDSSTEIVHRQSKRLQKVEAENAKLKFSYELVLNMLVSKNQLIEQLETDLAKLRGVISKSSFYPQSDDTDSK